MEALIGAFALPVLVVYGIAYIKTVEVMEKKRDSQREEAIRKYHEERRNFRRSRHLRSSYVVRSRYSHQVQLSTFERPMTTGGMGEYAVRSPPPICYQVGF